MMESCRRTLPMELDLPADFGFTMKGWDFDSATVRAAIENHRMLNPAMELGSNICPWEVFDCPGEAISLGNVKQTSLAALWGQARSITRAFDGGCFPREQFWELNPQP